MWMTRVLFAGCVLFFRFIATHWNRCFRLREVNWILLISVCLMLNKANTIQQLFFAWPYFHDDTTNDIFKKLSFCKYTIRHIAITNCLSWLYLGTNLKHCSQWGQLLSQKLPTYYEDVRTINRKQSWARGREHWYEFWLWYFMFLFLWIWQLLVSSQSRWVYNRS